MDNYNMENQMNQMEPMAPVQPKSKLKWILIIGIPVLAIAIVTTILFICVFNSSYDVDDYDKLAKASKKVFNLELRKLDAKEFSTATAATMGTDVINVHIDWIRYNDESKFEEVYDNRYLMQIQPYENMENAVIDNDENITTVVVKRKNVYGKVMFIKGDNAVLYVSVSGKDEKAVKELLEEFLDEID